MAFRVNGAAPMIKAEVTAAISSVAASSNGTKVVAVSGVTTDMIVDAQFASAHSAGFFIEECFVLSANNLQLTFANTTNGAIVHGSTVFRFVSR